MGEMKEYFRSEAEKHLSAAEEIAKAAKTAVRNLTEEEAGQVKDHMTKATEFGGKLEEIENNEKLEKSIEDLGKSLIGSPEQPEQGEARSPGELFVRSNGYKALLERGVAGARFTVGPVEFSGKMAASFFGGKATITTTAGDNENVLVPTRVPGIIGPAEQPLTIAELMNQNTVTSGNSVTFVRETVTTNAAVSGGDAVIVAEGSPKPESTIGFNTDSETLVKLATTMKITEEALEDLDQLRAYLDQRLRLFVGTAEERYIYNKLVGEITDYASGADIGGDSGNWFDAILAGITDVRVNSLLEPDGLLVHPLDLAEMQVQKSVAGDGNYFSGGPFASPRTNPWGLRAVVTTAIDAGTVLVGAFRTGAAVWRKGGLRVEATNSNEDDFVNNLVTIRGEERVALTVYRPRAFSIVRQGS